MQMESRRNVQGINVSSIQVAATTGGIDWQAVKDDGIAFVYARAYDASGPDAEFENIVAGAKGVSLPVGGYYYATPTNPASTVTDRNGAITSEAQSQAQQFIDKLESGFGAGQYGDLFPVLDFESYPTGLTATELDLWITSFRNYFENSSNGERALMVELDMATFSDAHGIDSTINSNEDMPLMVIASRSDAVYGSAPIDFSGWTSWVVWFYSTGGQVGGITGAVALMVAESLSHIELPVKPNTPQAIIDGSDVILTWNPTSDYDIRVYNIVRDGAYLATTPSTTYTDASVSDPKSHTYSVQAFDLWNQRSPMSDTAVPQSPSDVTQSKIDGFAFNGIDSKEYFLVNRVSKSILPPLTEKVKQVDGRAGQYDFGVNIGPREFNVEITLTEPDQESFNDRVRAVAEWLFTDEPQTLVFDNEPNIAYTARLKGNTDLTTLGTYGTATLTFLASDPYGYGEEVVGTMNTTQTTVYNRGSVETYPKFTVYVKSDMPNILISKALEDGSFEYVKIGSDADVEKTQKPHEELVFNDYMSDNTLWATAGAASETVIAGTVNSNGHNVYPSSYYADSSYDPDYSKPTASGQPYTNWHGPAVKRTLTTPLTDFVARVWVSFKAWGKDRVGRLEVHLLDANGAILAELSLNDNFVGTENVRGAVRLGPNDANAPHKYLISANDAGTNLWNDFWGHMDIRREGNRWNAYIAQTDASDYHDYNMWTSRAHIGYFYDTAGDFAADVAQIQVTYSAYRDYKPYDVINVDRIKVYKVNTIDDDTEVKLIAEDGDVIEIDHEKAKVTKNGQPFMTDLDPSSEFFSLSKGGNAIVINADGGDVQISYKERWL